MKYSLFAILLACSLFQPIRTVDLLPKHGRYQHEFKAKNYAVATQGAASSKAALSIFKQGGNVVDAFAAVSFAIGVERPQSTGIGGGGFLVLHLKDFPEPIAFDFREQAPLNSHKDMFVSKGKDMPGLSRNGPLAVAVPGLVNGVLEIHQKFGNLSREKILAPAISLAEEGLPVYPHLARAIKVRQKVLKKYGDGGEIFFKNGKPLEVGDRLFQKDLAKTLKLIAKKGKAGFYQGEVGDSIVRTVNAYGGIYTKKDMSQLKLKERKPIQGTYLGYKVFSMPPPSSGGTHILQILNILENTQLKKYGPQSWEAVHYTASAMQMAFADRAEYLGDDDFNPVPVNKLTSKKYAKSLYDKISLERALDSKQFPQKKLLLESDDTTHFTIMDQEGNIATSTQTINGWFGSGVVAKGTGVVLNNEMDDFAAKIGASNLFGAIGGKNNLVEPKKRPLSSMSPTIVFKGDKPYLTLGTPSGTRILTCVAQVLLNVLEYEMPLYQAVGATRVHHQWYPEKIFVEKSGLRSETIEQLKKLGHVVESRNLGCKIQAIIKSDHHLTAVSDQRGEGLATGN